MCKRIDFAGHSCGSTRRAEFNLDIGTCITRVGTKSFALGNGIFLNGECVATASSVIVSFNYDTRQSVPIPDVVRDKLAGLMPKIA